jgi:hypothetical protein
VTVAAAALAGGLLVATVDPNEPGHYPTCPFLTVTGLFCPGCGALRAVHALLHGDLGTAVASNVVVTAAAPLAVLWWARWASRCWSGSPRRPGPPAWALWGLIAVVVAFGVLRNLPGVEALAP